LIHDDTVDASTKPIDAGSMLRAIERPKE